MKLKDTKRFVIRNGKKPIGKWQDPNNWLSYDDALNKAKTIENGGISVVLGKIDNTPYKLAVVDADTIRNKNTGEVDETIKIFIEPFKHKHLSLSEYGYHCLCLIKDDFVLNKGNKKKINSNIDVERYENGNKKEPEIEFYTENRVIALPLNIDADLDNIVEQTKEYERVYNKYMIKPNTDEWFNALLNGDRLTGNDESKNDYALMGEIKKRGYSKDDAIKMFLNSTHFNTKDTQHQKKCDRDDYLPNLYDEIEIEANIDETLSKKDMIISIFDKCQKYKDKMGRALIYVDNNIYIVKSEDFKEEIILLCHKMKLKMGKEAINNIVSILNAEIRKTAPRIDLDVRVAQNKNGDFLCQLNDKEMVITNNNGFYISDILEPIFKRYNINLDQVKPSVDKVGNELDEILNILNINDDDRFLLKIYIITLFIPTISKPILVLNAEKGTGKTTLTRIIKDLVDPSAVPTGALDKNFDNLIIKFEHSYLVCFDNLDSITNDQSNILCRACTGEAISKRALYSNDDDFVYSYKRPIIINGINCPTNREDLIDRSILVDLKKLDNKNRKTDKDIFNMVENLKPKALAYIFNTISNTRVIKDKTKVKGSARLFDWYEWAYCIADIIETNGGVKFSKIFKRNLEKQNNTIINNTDVALCLKEYTSKLKIGESIEKTTSDLYYDLQFVSANKNYYYFPKTPSILTKDINRLIGVLEKEGILIETNIKKTDANYIKITKVKVNEND